MKVFVKKKHIDHAFDVQDIVTLEADSNYTIIYLANGERYTLSKPLGVTIKRLNELERNNLVRISRSVSVNIKKIESLKGNMVNICKREFQMSKSYRSQVLSKLNFL